MQEIALVTMKDITKDRSMRYDEALDGQVNESNISLIIIPYMIFYEIFILDLLKKNAVQIWRSTSRIDAGLFTIASRSQTISDMYEKCDPIPKVRIMQVLFSNFARR